MSLITSQLDQTALANVLQSTGSAIYGVVLNDQDSIESLGEQLSQPPYKAPAKAPVLYIKPQNTIAANGETVVLPKGADAVEVGATIALVIGQRATRVAADSALSNVAGIAVVADLSLPHDSYYRPAIREKCFDGALPVSDTVASLATAPALNQITLVTSINGEVVAERTLNRQVREADQLLADVTEFMSLRAGDVLLVGVNYQATQAKAGDTVTVSAEGVGEVSFILSSAEDAA